MNSVQIPWGAWYGDEAKTLEFPSQAEVQIAEIPYRPPLSSAAISTEFEQISGLVSAKIPGSIVIVVDDLTRPLKMETVVNVLLEKLQTAGVEKDKIKILIGGGGHRPLSDEDVAKKLGWEVVGNYPIINHSPFEDLAELPLSWKGTPVRLNKTFVEADFRIIISGLVPHSFAGFSGGAKMLFPGIADLEIIKRTHKSVLMGFMGKLGEVEGNRFRSEIEKLAVEVGVDYFVGLVGNPLREVVAIFSGDVVDAHRQAAAYAREYYTLELTHEPFDVVLVNSYPKDTELLQAENAFIPLHSTSKKLVKDDGVVIVTAACSEGMGYHELFGPGKVLYRQPRPKRFLKDKQFLLYSENITAEDFHQLFAEDYLFFSDWTNIKEWMVKRFSGKFRVLVFPYASLQMVE